MACCATSAGPRPQHPFSAMHDAAHELAQLSPAAETYTLPTTADDSAPPHAHSMPLGSFITTLLRKGRVTRAVLITSLLYMHRYSTVQKSVLGCNHCIFLGCIMLASKYVDDSSFKNRHWAMWAGLDTKYVCSLERYILEQFDYNLFVDVSTFEQWATVIYSGRGSEGLTCLPPAARQLILSSFMSRPQNSKPAPAPVQRAPSPVPQCYPAYAMEVHTARLTKLDTPPPGVLTPAATPPSDSDMFGGAPARSAVRHAVVRYAPYATYWVKQTASVIA
eukprot:comp11799_c0_seq1/m.6408 comp11799_c0_seq1/g.6408  ORF comp11799_c0_seq1/g.6408 comp11799_c0_seq1/m.6408 type:complete len:277 (-) comp11799_c0_seq1:258-1088(-)